MKRTVLTTAIFVLACIPALVFADPGEVRSPDGLKAYKNGVRDISMLESKKAWRHGHWGNEREGEDLSTICYVIGHETKGIVMRMLNIVHTQPPERERVSFEWSPNSKYLFMIENDSNTSRNYYCVVGFHGDRPYIVSDYKEFHCEPTGEEGGDGTAAHKIFYNLEWTSESKLLVTGEPCSHPRRLFNFATGEVTYLTPDGEAEEAAPAKARRTSLKARPLAPQPAPFKTDGAADNTAIRLLFKRR